MLFGSVILEVAIGLVFVYLLLSLLCSAINEYIEVRLNNRAQDLERGIRMLLSDPQGSGLSRDIYNHPLVRGLYRDENKLPSYIPSQTFALALWNMATSRAGSAGGGVTADLRAIRETVSEIPSAEVRTALLTLIDEAGGSLERARANIESWYDAAMDRVSGWYKRRVQKFLIVIGAIVCVLINADTISIGTALARNDALRSTVVAAAENTERAPAARDPRAPEEKVRALRAEINQLGLPLGWAFDKSFQDDARGVPHGLSPAALSWLLLKVIGLSLTVLAISQGAPFWFDILNKFIVIRSTVKPAEKSREQPSKDRPAPRTEIEKRNEEDEPGKG